MLEIIFPLEASPNNVDHLQLVLQIYYINHCELLATDADCTILLALTYMPEEYSGVKFVETLQELILTTTVVRQVLGLASTAVSSY